MPMAAYILGGVATLSLGEEKLVHSGDCLSLTAPQRCALPAKDNGATRDGGG